MSDLVDYHRFRVVCQKCGKTGIVDTYKPVGERGFFRRMDERRGKKWQEPVLDYYLCAECMEA